MSNDFLDLSQVDDAESFLRLVDEGDGWDTAEAGPDLAELKRSVLAVMDSLDASLEEKVLFLALALWQAARPRPGVTVFGVPLKGSLQNTARALLDRIDQAGTLAMLGIFKEGKDFPKIIAAMGNQLLEEPELQVDGRQFVFEAAAPLAPTADPGAARPAWEFFLRDSLSLAENRLPFGAADLLQNGYHPARCEFRADAFPGRVQNRRALASLGLTGMAHPLDLAGFTGTWLNLRGEAVLYFGGEPFNLRRLNGSCNSDYEGDEATLARELGEVPLLREMADGKLERSTSSERPRTCAELAGGSYQRLRWSDEGAPQASWLAELHALNLQGPVLVTCHQGKARTSLALTALALRRLGATAAPDLQHLPEWRQLGEAYRRQDGGGLPAWLQAGQQRIVEQKARRLAERFALLSCYAEYLGQGQGVFEVQSALYQRQLGLMIDNLLR